MTACTNHGGKARRVVTAALVGVLSVGTVPMVALAAGAGDAVSPMFATGGIDGTEFSNGTAKVEVFKNGGDGKFDDAVTVYENEDGKWECSAWSLPYVVTISELDVAGTSSATIINDDNIHDYKIRVYRADEDGNATGGALSGNKVTSAGEYVVVVTALTGSPYAGQSFKSNLVVKGNQLPEVRAFENGEDQDLTFTYTGGALDVDFQLDGNENGDGVWTHLVEGKDYTVSYTRNGKAVDEVKDNGTYVATLKGLGKYAGTQTKCSFTVDKFVIDSSTEVVIAPFDETGPDDNPISVVKPSDGGSYGTFEVSLDPSLVTIVPSGTSTSAYGPHDFTLTTSDPNVVLSADTFEGLKVENVLRFEYHNADLADSYELYASEGDDFDTSDIEAFYGKKEVAVNDATDVKVDLVKKASGVTYSGNDMDDLNEGVVGVYEVTVEVEDGSTYKYAGAAKFTVTIYKGTMNADESVYVYAPDAGIAGSNTTPVAITSYAKGYDGDELTAGSFDVVFKGMVADDLTVELVDSEGNEVDSAVNAGEYKLVVTSDWYKLSGTTELPITIGKVDLTTLAINKLVKWNDVAGQEYLPLDSDPDTAGIQSYVCNAVDAVVEGLGLAYDTGNGSEEEFVEDNYKGLDLLPYVVDVIVEINDGGTWKEVGAIEDAGDYRVTVTVAEEIASNFVLPEGATSVTREFTVADKSLLFSDVQPSDWYYDAVSKALKNQYMRGYAGTTTFGPEDKLTRAQAVIVLYNMSGISFKADTDSSYDETKGWVTGFDDVDGHAYYAQAVAWANKTGVVNGYDEDTFGPEDEITREQFAAMLSNYAKVVNRDETVDSADQSVLADFADANTVSDWARGAVAWAASATEDRDAVMGNNGSLMGQNKITRGEVAAMVTNYQPNPKATIW